MKEQSGQLTGVSQRVYAGSMVTVTPESLTGRGAGSAANDPHNKQKEAEEKARQNYQREAEKKNQEEKVRPTPEGIKAGEKAKLVDPVKKQQIDIKTIEDLKAFTIQLERELEENPSQNPFIHIDTLQLVDMYFSAGLVGARLSATSSFGHAESVPGHLQIYNRLLTEELRKRDIDTVGLFHQLNQKIDEAGFTLRGVGAAPLTDERYDQPSLAAIVTEINSEAERLGENRSLNPEYLMVQRERVQRLIDNATIPVIAIPQAHELINTLNERINIENEREGQQRERQQIEGGHIRVETIGDRSVRRQLGLQHERMLLLEEKQAMRNAIDEIYTRAHGVPKELAEHEALDELFNRMFEYADQGLREEFRQAFGIGEREKEIFKQELSNMIDEYRKELEKAPDANSRNMWRDKAAIVGKFQDKYDVEFTTRELLHNAFYIVETEREFEDFAKFVKNFQSGFADQAFLNAPEVETALRIREQVLYELRREHGGYLPPELVTYNTGKGETEWEKRTKELMDKLNEKGFFSPTGQHVKEWKIHRALSLSRGLGMVLLRFPEIVAEGMLPSPVGDWQAQASLPWEKIVWDLNPLDHKVKRYEFGHGSQAILYAARHRTKKGLWNQDELKHVLKQDAVSVLGTFGDDERIADMRNLFRTGGPVSHTGWRGYLAALKEDRSALKDNLKRNPGLAMSNIFNRYETNGLGQKRYERYLQNKQMEDLDPEKAEREWEEEVKRLEGTPEFAGKKVAWERAETESWKNSSRRIPHAILRIVLDEANMLLKKPERNALIRRVEQAAGGPIGSAHFTEIEHALELAKEHLMKRRRDAEREHRPFTEDDDQLKAEDFGLIEDEHVRVQAQNLHRVVVSEMDTNTDLLHKIFEKVDKRMFPYAVTMQDVPWSELNFAQTGPRGFFTRKVNDAESVAQADVELEKLIKHLHQFKSGEEVAAQMVAIFDKAEIYDYTRAQEAMADLAIGVIRYFEKDGITKIPILGEILGPINAIRGRGQSFAQTLGGAHCMAWDSDDIYAFTEHLRQMFINDRGKIDMIRKETGGTLWHAIGKKTKIAFYLLGIFLSYEMVEKLISEKS